MPKKPVKTEDNNIVYALHYKGKLLGTFKWEGGASSTLQSWRPPKKLYFKEHQAKTGAAHLPTDILDDVELVEYVPVRVLKRFSTQERKDYLHKKEIEFKKSQLEYSKAYHKDSIKKHQRELDELLKKQ